MARMVRTEVWDTVSSAGETVNWLDSLQQRNYFILGGPILSNRAKARQEDYFERQPEEILAHWWIYSGTLAQPIEMESTKKTDGVAKKNVTCDTWHMTGGEGEHSLKFSAA